MVFFYQRSFRAMVLKLQSATESPGRPVEPECWAPPPGVSDSVGLGWGLRIYILNEFPGNADTAARGTTLEKWQVKEKKEEEERGQRGRGGGEGGG